jgi:hypothetical protein
MILNEGGNVFADAKPFDHKIIPQINKVINDVIKTTGAESHPIGSGATPTPGKVSGDLDVIVDADAIMGHFNSPDAKTARKDLRALFDKAGLQTAQTGTSVHVRVPVGDEAHQVDVMVVPNAGAAVPFHTHSIPKGSPYKGVHKQILIADLAKAATTEDHPEGFKWSAFKGLLDRRDDSLVSNNLDEIAKILLGNNATGKDLGSVESMVKVSPKAKELANALDANEDPKHPWNAKKVQPAESLADRNHNRVVELMKALS